MLTFTSTTTITHCSHNIEPSFTYTFSQYKCSQVPSLCQHIWLAVVFLGPFVKAFLGTLSLHCNIFFLLFCVLFHFVVIILLVIFPLVLFSCCLLFLSMYVRLFVCFEKEGACIPWQLFCSRIRLNNKWPLLQLH